MAEAPPGVGWHRPSRRAPPAGHARSPFVAPSGCRMPLVLVPTYSASASESPGSASPSGRTPGREHAEGQRVGAVEPMIVKRRITLVLLSLRCRGEGPWESRAGVGPLALDPPSKS